jgi:hypothetical protein
MILRFDFVTTDDKFNYWLFAGIMKNLIVDHDSDKLNESSPQSLFFVNHLMGSLFD